VSGPYPFARQMQSIDQLLAAQPDWGMLDKLMPQTASADGFRPDDTVQRFLGAMAGEPAGRAVLEWIADMTVRAGPGDGGASFEARALAHAAHQARFDVGRAIFRAVADGVELINHREPAR
jgi:hypothetical protein